MEKLGCLQLRWQSWAPCSAESNKQGFGASHLIHFGCLLFPGSVSLRWSVRGPWHCGWLQLFSETDLERVLAHSTPPSSIITPVITTDGKPSPTASAQHMGWPRCCLHPVSTLHQNVSVETPLKWSWGLLQNPLQPIWQAASPFAVKLGKLPL